jgi:hypothetical protein
MAEINQNKLKCLRHRIKPSGGRCDLCEAKEEAKGNVEKARRLFVNRK